MQRLRRLSEFWSWLPAFRAVAETQHLPTAAQHLLVSASALSRSIRLLEDDIGTPLFRRSRGTLELNADGEQFLAALRDGMRMIHEGLLHVQGQRRIGSVFISSAGHIASLYVLPALRRIRRRCPELVAHVRLMDPVLDGSAILRGEIDVAFSNYAAANERLCRVSLGAEPTGVYCGPGHPVYRRRVREAGALAGFEFAATVHGPSGQSLDGWPADRPRRVGLSVDQAGVALDICARGEMLAVLPAALVDSAPGGRGLRRLPVDVSQPIPLFATHRPPICGEGSAEILVAAVSEAIESVHRPSTDREGLLAVQ